MFAQWLKKIAVGGKGHGQGITRMGTQLVAESSKIADKMDDKETEKLSGEIANKIQTEMTYPGQVKITVIRETRSVAYAK